MSANYHRPVASESAPWSVLIDKPIMLDVTFYGVRGSTPCSGSQIQHFGGNTSCVLISVPGERPIICDLGTGLRQLGVDLAARGEEVFQGTALVSHLHWDHVQGVPFFGPVLREGACLDVFGPAQQDRSLAEVVDQFLAPPLFPIGIKDLPGTFTFTEVTAGSFPVGSATVTAFPVSHIGAMNGYRIDLDGASVAYISDCQEPLDGRGEVGPAVLEACHGVDILIHDAQYSAAELAERRDWGHCTADYALKVAASVGAKRLVLFHHDPAHDDDWIEAEVARIGALAALSDFPVEVLAAKEGMVLRSPQGAKPVG